MMLKLLGLEKPMIDQSESSKVSPSSESSSKDLISS
ncbi:hypothetical protein BVRB_5g115620 [Beta vulgaris subsp. vulgaris]|nr:hypothetical protein BVRB_5g115620 [Beta vulgaris subsp. vulgaris]